MKYRQSRRGRVVLERGVQDLAVLLREERYAVLASAAAALAAHAGEMGRAGVAELAMRLEHSSGRCDAGGSVAALVRLAKAVDDGTVCTR